MIKYVSDNASWIFSGIGLTVITGLIWIIRSAFVKKSNSQTQTISGNGVGYQAGGDIISKENSPND